MRLSHLLALGAALFSLVGILFTAAVFQRTCFEASVMEWSAVVAGWLLVGSVIAAMLHRLAVGPSERAAFWFAVTVLLCIGCGAGFEVEARTVFTTASPAGSSAPIEAQGRRAMEAVGKRDDAHLQNAVEVAPVAGVPVRFEFDVRWGVNVWCLLVTVAGTVVLLRQYARTRQA